MVKFGGEISIISQYQKHSKCKCSYKNLGLIEAERILLAAKILNPGRDRTDLHFAVFYNNLSEIDQQIENGSDINARNNDEETPLHIACLGDSECNNGPFLSTILL
ncbi:hypothetical protein WA026_004366 [Henosepilachna vigintioctopunctata]|uniref:Ankyrin repeat protein n=1 Tax=Henosepilachna vigintioctopunctata TaxID=420089 RepID=A0AAW1V6R2_9CUCU